MYLEIRRKIAVEQACDVRGSKEMGMTQVILREDGFCLGLVMRLQLGSDTPHRAGVHSHAGEPWGQRAMLRRQWRKKIP